MTVPDDELEAHWWVSPEEAADLSRSTLLVHLPRLEGWGEKPYAKNGPSLGGYGAAAMNAALTEAMTELPGQLRKTLTWDRGKELSGHAQFALESGTRVFFADPHSPWQRPTNENTNDRLTSKNLLPSEHLLDAGYTSAELLLTAPTLRGVSVVGPVRSNNTRQSVQSIGFGKTAFAIDWQAEHAVCPTGAKSRYWTAGLDNNGRDAIRIRFATATATCAPCPVRDQCTRSTKYGRQLTVRPQEQAAVLERVRAEQSTDGWKDRYAARAGVEGTIH